MSSGAELVDDRYIVLSQINHGEFREFQTIFKHTALAQYRSLKIMRETTFCRIFYLKPVDVTLDLLEEEEDDSLFEYCSELAKRKDR